MAQAKISEGPKSQGSRPIVVWEGGYVKKSGTGFGSILEGGKREQRFPHQVGMRQARPTKQHGSW